MKLLERTHGIRFELMRHFLATLFDSEMFSARGQWGTIAISAFSLVIPAGMILLESPPNRPLAASLAAAQALAQSERLSTLTLLLSITAILALLAWQSLFPSRRDYLALAGLPVRSRQIFAARFTCVLLLAAAITCILILPALSTSHAISLVDGHKWRPVSTLPARASSTGLGCLFIFFSLVSLQGLLINVLPARRLARWSGYLQGLLLGFALLSGLYSWFIPDWAAAAVPKILRNTAWAPPVWFLGLHETMSGTRDPFLLALSVRAIRATEAAMALAALTYTLANVRFRRLLLEGGEGLAPQRLRGGRFLRFLARNPREEAILQFIAAVLSRSRIHRLVLMAYGGAAAAIMTNSVVLGAPPRVTNFIVLYWPLGFSLIVLAAIRHAFVMPAEWKANWLFRVTESQGRRDWLNAVERFVLFVVIAPIHLVSLPVSIGALGVGVALRMTVLQTLVSLAVFEFLFFSWQQLPFACSYVPGKTSLILQLGAWLGLFTIVVPRVALMVAALAQIGSVFYIYTPIFVAVWLWARYRRRDGWGEAPLLYEDTLSAPADLGIRELSYRGVQAQIEVEQVPDLPKRSFEQPAGSPQALRVYRALSRLFPQEFQDAYGEEMNRTAEDAMPQVGPVRLLGDTALRLCAEHAAQFGRDVRFGLRSLAGSPGFTAVALISLGLGMCIATCAFSEMNGMVLRDLPGATHTTELVSIERATSYPLYRRYHARWDLFVDSTAYVPAVPFGVLLNGHTERIWGQLVTPSYFATFGVKPERGRLFDPNADFRTAVVSYRFWQEHLDGDPGAIGHTLRVNGQPVTILGITPKGFLGAMPTTPADLWLPFPPDPAIVPALPGDALEHGDLTILTVVARLQPGIMMPMAEAALDTVARQFEQDTGNPNRNRPPGRRVTLAEGGKCLPLRKQDKPFFTSFFTILAGLIMLIACANVANMMLARAAARRREIAVRLALGAGRGRIVRQLLTESLLLAVTAGLAGALVSAWLMRALRDLRMPLPIPVTYNFLQPDHRVLLLTFVLSLATGLLFGLAPALQATRADLTPALKEGGNIRLLRYRHVSLRSVLMVSQMAGSLTLLVTVGFLAIGIQSTLGVQAGFNPANLFLISLDPTQDGYSAQHSADFFPKLLNRVQTLPFVRAASLSVTVPVSMVTGHVTFYAPGDKGTKELHDAIRHTVGKDYFATTGIPILAGRAFRLQDETEDSMAIIVTDALAKTLWPTRDAVGHMLEVANAETSVVRVLRAAYDYRPSTHTRTSRRFEVIGVAGNVSEGLIAGKPQPAIYFPIRPSDYAQPSQQGVTLIVRAAPGVDAIALVRGELAAMDPTITPFSARTMAQHVDEFVAPLRMATWTYAFVGFFGLMLSAVGLAGMTAYSVAGRSHEIGIRLALGARHENVLGLVMKDGIRLIAIGTAVGMACAWAASRGLAAMSATVGQVASTSASDPVVLYGAPLLLATLALAACYIPARKSLAVDPVVTLRQE